MAWQIAQQSQTVEGLRAERRSLDDAVGRMKNDIATLQATVQKKDQDLAQQLEQERLDRQNLEKQRAQNAGPLGLIASFVLRAGSVRGANDQPARLLIPRSAQSVRLQLDLETPREYRSYRADLRTAAGASVWAGDMLRPKTTDSGEAVVAELPADILAPGNYELALLGMAGGGKLEEVSYYYFGVQQR
jgi:hypothetical protein